MQKICSFCAVCGRSPKREFARARAHLEDECVFLLFVVRFSHLSFCDQHTNTHTKPWHHPKVFLTLFYKHSILREKQNTQRIQTMRPFSFFVCLVLIVIVVLTMMTSAVDAARHPLTSTPCRDFSQSQCAEHAPRCFWSGGNYGWYAACVFDKQPSFSHIQNETAARTARWTSTRRRHATPLSTAAGTVHRGSVTCGVAGSASRSVPSTRLDAGGPATAGMLRVVVNNQPSFSHIQHETQRPELHVGLPHGDGMRR